MNIQRKIRCVAIDDEPLALAQLQRFAERLPDVELLGTYYSVDDARHAILSQQVDLLFLDIEMPDCTGTEFARLMGDRCPSIIFTTAYPQYAIDGFRLDAVDYLLKPLNFEELTVAVEKVKRRLGLVAGLTSQPKEIYVKSSGTLHKIDISEILYIKGLAEYVQIYQKGNRTPITTFDSIKRFEQELCPNAFMRVHKSYLVNLSAIDSASRQQIVIAGETIPIGEKYRPDFVKYMKDISGR